MTTIWTNYLPYEMFFKIFMKGKFGVSDTPDLQHLGYTHSPWGSGLGLGSTLHFTFLPQCGWDRAGDGSSSWVGVNQVEDLHGAPSAPFQLLDPRLLQTFVKWTNEWELWFFGLLKKISLFSCVSVNEIHNQFKFKHFGNTVTNMWK